MRVISGKAKGTRLKSLDGMETRPTLDRIKESLFNIIAPYVEDSDVLDLFAGTGSLGIEALSRGAKSCIFVDKQRIAFEIVCENVKLTKLENYSQVILKDWGSFLKMNTKTFDLVFLDPPYSKGIEEEVMPQIGNFVNEGGIVVIERENDAFEANHFEIIKNVKYGRVRLVMYKKIKLPSGS